jgi:hypothetical protein
LELVLRYGRSALDFDSKLEPDDVPLKPGETLLLKVPERYVLGWEKARREEDWPQPEKIGLGFPWLNFGDGMGFWGTNADVWPYPRRKP